MNVLSSIGWVVFFPLYLTLNLAEDGLVGFWNSTIRPRFSDYVPDNEDDENEKSLYAVMVMVAAIAFFNVLSQQSSFLGAISDNLVADMQEYKNVLVFILSRTYVTPALMMYIITEVFPDSDDKEEVNHQKNRNNSTHNCIYAGTKRSEEKE